MKPSEIVRELAGQERIHSLVRVEAEKPSKMVLFHHSLGQDIRNRYGFWKPECPWTNDNSCVINGIDYNPFHPDTVSTRILEALWCYVRNVEYDLSWLDVEAPL